MIVRLGGKRAGQRGIVTTTTTTTTTITTTTKRMIWTRWSKDNNLVQIKKREGTVLVVLFLVHQ